MFTTAYARTTIPVDLGEGTTALICVDRGRIVAGGSRSHGAGVPICELEIELAAGNPARLFEFAMLLADDLPLAIESRSKAERGFALIEPARPEAVHAQPVDLKPGLPTADALRSVVANCVRQIEANARGVRERKESEYVHQMRVGARRLRSCLQLAGHLVPEGSLTALVADVRWLAQALGPARDFDVLLEQTLAPLVAAAKADPAGAVAQTVSPLQRRAAARRRRARADAREAVGSKRFQRLLLRIGQLCATPAFGVAVDSQEAQALERPVVAYAHEVVARRHRQLLRAGAALAAASPIERHETRIAAKKLRYAIEFFVSLLPSKRARTMIKALSRLQDALGRGNDVQVALGIAAEIAGEASRADAMLAGWAAAQQPDTEREIASAWDAFVACRTFWKE